MCLSVCACVRVYTHVVFTIVERISMKYVRHEMQLLLLPFITCATVALNNTEKKTTRSFHIHIIYMHVCLNIFIAL